MQKQIVNTLSLKTYPDPCLRLKTLDVEEFTDETNSIVKSMAEVMYKSQGIGLAAPQVGLSLSLFIIDIGEGLKAFINPKITKQSREKDSFEEGCLSLPGIGVTVSRSTEIELQASDQHGNSVTGTFEGLEAKAIQHEMDHLLGKMIIDYMNPFTRFISAFKIKRQMRTKQSGDAIL
jgi:peptide deformylase